MLEISEDNGSALVRAAGRTDVGVVRATNEDAFLIADLTNPESSSVDPIGTYHVGASGVLLAVSDGMGGALAGEVASALVVESLRDHLDGDCKSGQIIESVRCAIEKANHDVWRAAHVPGREGMGATLVAVVVHRALAYVACVGDSRAYLVRDGAIRQITKDQSYVETLIDAGVMTREEAERSPFRSSILQAMGLRPDVRVVLSRLPIFRGDVFLVCSDGLSGKVGDADLLRVLKEGPTFSAACRSLIELANSRGGEDNSTVIIAEVSGEAFAVPAPTFTVTQEFASS